MLRSPLVPKALRASPWRKYGACVGGLRDMRALRVASPQASVHLQMGKGVYVDVVKLPIWFPSVRRRSPTGELGWDCDP